MKRASQKTTRIERPDCAMYGTCGADESGCVAYHLRDARNLLEVHERQVEKLRTRIEAWGVYLAAANPPSPDVIDLMNALKSSMAKPRAKKRSAKRLPMKTRKPSLASSLSPARYTDIPISSQTCRERQAVKRFGT